MYEILKIGAAVKVLRVNNENMTGNIFITEALLSARGIPLTEDFLNEADDRFLPFESAARPYSRLNKHVVVDIKTGPSCGQVSEQTPIKPRNQLAHFTKKGQSTVRTIQ